MNEYNDSYAVADYGTEQMMIQENGEVFVHYTDRIGAILRHAMYR